MIDEKKLLDDLIYCKGLGRKSLEAVIEVIKAQPKTDCSECSRRKFYQQGYQDGLNADKWIPCEERLPEEMCRCLVTTKDEKVTETIYDKPFDRFVLCEDAIAWQPLPAPYKKEGGTDD